MTAINRTAYPRLDARLNHEELRARYTLTETDRAFIRASARGESGSLMFALLLKTRQDFGCFPALDEMQMGTVIHLASQLGFVAPNWPGEAHRTKSLYRYQAAVRAYLSVTPYGNAAEELVTTTTLQAAEVMSDPADLINRAVETLQIASIDLPAFSTLDRLVNRLRTEVHERIYIRVVVRMTAEQMAVLDALLIKLANSITTAFNRLKQTPGPATRQRSDFGSIDSIGLRGLSTPTRCWKALPIPASPICRGSRRARGRRSARHLSAGQAIRAVTRIAAPGAHAQSR